MQPGIKITADTHIWLSITSKLTLNLKESLLWSWLTTSKLHVHRVAPVNDSVCIPYVTPRSYLCTHCELKLEYLQSATALPFFFPDVRVFTHVSPKSSPSKFWPHPRIFRHTVKPNRSKVRMNRPRKDKYDLPVMGHGFVPLGCFLNQILTAQCAFKCCHFYRLTFRP